MATAVYTNAGQAGTADVVDPNTRGAESTTFYGAYGRGATAAAVTDTALVDEITDEGRVAATVSQPAADTVRWLWEVTASVDHLETGTGGVEEAGVFDASASGALWLRANFPVINIQTGDRIEFTFDLTWADQSEV